MEFRSKLSYVKIGSNKLDVQLCQIENITKFYNSQKGVIKFFDYFKILHKAAYHAKYGKGLKILTPKQIIQRLPIALAKVKAANTFEKLLNEIRQIKYYLYRAK